MSIFTRREIQKRLNILSTIVGRNKLTQSVKRLNVEGNASNENRILESLAEAWEVVIVAAFCETGDTKYEMKISNEKTPDIWFHNCDTSLIGDVFTVSDEQQSKKNPADEFSRILYEIWKEVGPQKGDFSYRVGNIDIKPSQAQVKPIGSPLLHISSSGKIIRSGSSVRLTLPPLHCLDEYLQSKVRPFFQALQRCPDKPDRLSIEEPYDDDITVRFSISYNPEGGPYRSGSYASYTTVTDIERHVLSRRLKEKSDQFACATEECPRVLFVCDGSCAALKNTSSTVRTYSIGDIIDHFWKRPAFSEEEGNHWIIETGISAIIVLSIESSCGKEFELRSSLYLNPHSQFPLDEASKQLLSQIISKLPNPISSPFNALRAAERNPTLSRHFEPLIMSENKIEMSALSLLKILSGKLTMEEFCADYELMCNPFESALSGFQTIKSIKVEASEDRDDDKVIIEFNTRDSAIGPFIIPINNSGSISRE
jgi:hypothetical protein